MPKSSLYKYVGKVKCITVHCVPFKGRFLQSAYVNASNAITNVNSTFEQFCHLNRVRTRGGSSFACGDRERIHGAGRVRHREDNSYVFVRKTILISNLCLLCHIVHGFPKFQGPRSLGCAPTPSGPASVLHSILYA